MQTEAWRPRAGRDSNRRQVERSRDPCIWQWGDLGEERFRGIHGIRRRVAGQEVEQAA